MATVVLLGTLDTKGVEYGYLRDQIHRYNGCDVVMVDAGRYPWRAANRCRHIARTRCGSCWHDDWRARGSE